MFYRKQNPYVAGYSIVAPLGDDRQCGKRSWKHENLPRTRMVLSSFLIGSKIFFESLGKYRKVSLSA